ncbi:MAG TPA: SRPBCC family protein [Polyangia bacterium]|nr:SRPBCC family protein [Polyangia bacterium]
MEEYEIEITETADVVLPQTPLNGRPRRGRVERGARGLGWFGVGLGLVELAAPGALARLIGGTNTRRQRRTVRTLGLREVATGVAILTRPRSGVWRWTRLAGDLMDLALLGAAGRSRQANRRRLWMAAGAVVGVTVVDGLASVRASRIAGGEGQDPDATTAVRTIQTITVNRPVDEVFRFWRDFENLPQFMENLESVTVLDSRRSHWCARSLAGRKVEWEAELVEVRDNELIAWRSVDGVGSDVSNAGSVRFAPAPGGRGTEIHVDLQYEPPAGRLGAQVATVVARLFGKEPGQQVMADLRRFKQVMEVGEVIRSDASIQRGAHPARGGRTPPH